MKFEKKLLHNLNPTVQRVPTLFAHLEKSQSKNQIQKVSWDRISIKFHFHEILIVNQWISIDRGEGQRMLSFQKKLFLIVLLSTWNLGAEEAVVSFVKGKVNIRSSKDPKSTLQLLKKGDKVSEGTTILTGNGSSVTLVFNGSEFKVMQNSVLQLNDLPTKDKKGDVEVTNGFAWFKVENAGKGFQSRTPTSTAGVRGTAFATMYEPNVKTAMNCICHGKVEVSNTENKSVVLEKATGSMVVSGGEVQKTEYSKDFEKGEALPSFEAKVKSAPILKNCLSCHKTKGWEVKGTPKDETYGK